MLLYNFELRTNTLLSVLKESDEILVKETREGFQTDT